MIVFRFFRAWSATSTAPRIGNAAVEATPHAGLTYPSAVLERFVGSRRSGSSANDVPIKPGFGVDALYAPRRTVLDPILVGAAQRGEQHGRSGECRSMC